MNIRKLLLAAAAVLLLSPTASAQKKGNVLDISKSITDNSIIFPESFETDTQALLEGWYMKNYAATDDRYRTESDANTSDQQIIQRLSNLPSAIEMPFNQVVRKYIDRYAKSGRSLVTVCLGLGNYYIPIIEQALEEEGLPLELKYLPMIESAYNPNAVSRAGATGLWQFMLSAAKGYDMEVNSLVDERRDPIESSRKGARLLKDLYNTYGKWDLAIAAYNCGPGNVNKAIRRAGGDPKQHDFWSIYNYLPSETRGYFPMFVAANYIMNYYPDHNISPVVPKKPLITDTVSINYRVNLNQIAKVLDIPLDELRLLNPQFRKDIIPGSSQKSYMLILPSRQVASYIMSENDIRNFNASQYAQRTTAEPGKLQQNDDIVAEEITETDETISPDDELVAQEPPSEDSDADYRMVRQQSERKENEHRRDNTRQSSETSVADKVKAVAAGETITHKVAAGETLASIADTYHVSTSQLKMWNSLRRDAVRTGQEILVKGTATGASERRQETAAKGHTRARAAAAQEEAAPAKAAKPAKAAQNTKTETSRKPAKPATQQADDSSNSGTSKARQRRAQAAAADNAKADSKNTPKADRSSRKTKTDREAASSKDTKNTRQSRSSKQKAEQESARTSKNNRSQKTDERKNTTGKKNAGKNSRQKKEVEKPSNYEVQKGDSYERIAKKTGYSVEEIRKANGGKKGDMIHPGDKVNLPKKGKSTKADKSSKADKSPKADKSSKSSKASASKKADNPAKSDKSKKKR